MGNNKSERLHPNSLLDNSGVRNDDHLAEQTRTQKVQPEKAALAEPPADYSEEEEDYEEMPCNEKQIESIINNLDLEDAEIEQKLKDELDEEVDKKFKTQIREEYEEEFPADANEDYLKEDTIKTDKIEQIIEDEKKLEEDEYSFHDEDTPDVTTPQNDQKKQEKLEKESDYDEDYEF